MDTQTLPAAPAAAVLGRARRRAVLLVLGAAAVFSVAGAFVKLLDGAIPLAQVVFCRNLFCIPVLLLLLPRNGGFSYGCNLGAARGDAPYLLFLNPDARIDGAALAALRSTLDAVPAAGLAAPRILKEDGTLAWSLRRFPRHDAQVGERVGGVRLDQEPVPVARLRRPERGHGGAGVAGDHGGEPLGRMPALVTPASCRGAEYQAPSRMALDAGTTPT